MLHVGPEKFSAYGFLHRVFGWVVFLRAAAQVVCAVQMVPCSTTHTTYAAVLKTTTHPKTRCRKPYAANQHLMLLMMGVCTQNMLSYEYINKFTLLHQVGISNYFTRKMYGQTTLKYKDHLSLRGCYNLNKHTSSPTSTTLQSEHSPMTNCTQYFVLHLGGQEPLLALATYNHTYFVFGRLRALRYCCRVFTALTLPCFTCESVKIMNTSTGFFIFFAHNRG